MKTRSQTKIKKEHIPETKPLKEGIDDFEETAESSVAVNTQEILRENVVRVLEASTLMPFIWLKNKYRCFYCDETFQQPKDLKDHHVIHKTEEVAKTMTSFLDPAVNVDVPRISCKLCPEDIHDLYSLVDHLLIKHEILFNKDIGFCMNPYKLNDINVSCAICNGIYHNFTWLLLHTDKYHKGSSNVLCDICGSHFKTAERLKEHKEAQHDYNQVKCTLCDSKMERSALRTHIRRTHGNKHKCIKCTEVFSTTYKLTKHMIRVHDNREKIKCPQCPSTFFFRNELVRHQREQHLKEKYQ